MYYCLRDVCLTVLSVLEGYGREQILQSNYNSFHLLISRFSINNFTRRFQTLVDNRHWAIRILLFLYINCSMTIKGLLINYFAANMCTIFTPLPKSVILRCFRQVIKNTTNRLTHIYVDLSTKQVALKSGIVPHSVGVIKLLVEVELWRRRRAHRFRLEGYLSLGQKRAHFRWA